MAFTTDQLAEEVFQLKGAYNGIADDVKEIKQRLNDLYQKSEGDKTENIERSEQNKTELIERVESTKTKMIQWMVGLLLGFSVLIITAMWAILSFAI